MSTQNETGVLMMIAGEDLAEFRRVKMSSTTNRTVVYADAGEDFIGVTQAGVSDGDRVAVRMTNAGGTLKMVASAAISTRNSALYGAADGKVSGTAAGDAIGYALDTASGNGAVIEVLPALKAGETSIGALSAIDDDLGGTTGGTERFVFTSAPIDDDCGGTTGGTEQLAITRAAIDDDTGGTTGGTEQLATVTGTGYSAGVTTAIVNNFAVLAWCLNALRADVANHGAVLATEFNQLRADVANLGAVTANRINAIIAAGA